MTEKDFEKKLLTAMAVAKEYSKDDPEAFERAGKDYAQKMFFSLEDDEANFADIVTAACFTIFAAVDMVQDMKKENEGVH